MKVKYVEKLADLFGVLSRDQVVIPEDILKYCFLTSPRSDDSDGITKCLGRLRVASLPT